MNRLHGRNKRRRIFWITISALAIGFYIFLIIRTLVRNEQLRINKVITIGTVIDTGDSWRTRNTSLKYVFQIDGKKYKGTTSYIGMVSGFCETLIGRSFPVIYSSKSRNNNKMLLTREVFEHYDLEQPDSLRWVEKYKQK